MKIRSLEQMEKIVSSNKFLEWDGWTVLHLTPSRNGVTSKFGVYRNGKWYIQRRFEPNLDGWDIPRNFLEKNGSRRKKFA
jgi:hypothetical protein